MTDDQTTAVTRPWRGIALSAITTASIAGFLLMIAFLFGFAVDEYIPYSEEVLVVAVFGVMFAVLSAPLIWISLIVIGLPIHYILMRTGFSGLKLYAVAGQVAGFLCASLVQVAVPPNPTGGGTQFLVILLYAGMGGIAAALALHFSQAESA